MSKHRFGRRLDALVLVLTATVAATAGVSQWLLYRAAIEQHKQILSDMVAAQAGTLSAIFAHELAENEPREQALDDTVNKIFFSGHWRMTLEKSGEFLLGKLEDKRMVFLGAGGGSRRFIPPPAPIDSGLAEPMNRALKGQTGVMFGLDYAGKRVLAAYRYIPLLDLGLVAKVEVAELRAPFLRAGLLSLILGAFLILLCVKIFYRIGTPMTQFLQTLVDTSADAIVTIDAGGHVVEWNPSAERMFGWSREEAVGSSVSSLIIPPEKREAHLAGLARASRSGKTKFSGKTIELTAMRKDGGLFPIEMSLSLYAIHGAVYYTSLIRDISLRKEMEEKAEELGRLVETSHNEFYVVDAETLLFLRASRGACENLGYSSQELLGLNFKDVAAGPAPEVLRAKMNPASGDAEPSLILETRLRRKDGTRYPVQAQITRCEIAGRPVFSVVALDVTHLQEAREELRLQAEILNHMAEGVHLVSVKDKRIVYCNRQMERLLGYPVGALIGKEVSSLLASDGDRSPAEVRDDVLAALDDAGRWEGPVFTRKADGTAVWHQALISRFEHPRFGPVWLSVRRDVDAQTRAEAERVKVLEQLALATELVQQVGDELYLADPESGRFLYVNGQACTATGYCKEELLKLRVRDIAPAFASSKSWEDFIRRLKEGMASPDPVMTIQTEHKRKNGTLYPTEVRVRLIEQNGKLYGVASVRDVTLRKHFERERSRLLAAIEQSEDSIIITDASGIITYVNPAFSRTSGYAREEAMGKTPGILKSGKQMPVFYERLWETISHGETWRGIFVNKKKDGTLFYEEATISPVKPDGGETSNYVAIKRDITQSMQMQERMAQSEKLSSAGQIAAGVAHEVNNPLTVILGIAQILREDPELPSYMQEDIETIVKHARRAGKITQGMLAFSRKRAPNREPHDLRQLVGQTVPLIKHELVKHKMKLKLAYPSRAAWSNVDAEQIQEILINLVMNAKHAMEESPAREITLRVEKAGPRNLIRVTDTGSGIPENILGRIFEPFFTTKPVGKGTGLGLSICYGIAMENDGMLSVQSTVGRGTTFTIELPAYEHPESAVAAPAELKSA